MRDTKDTIDSYITDMLALEQHIEKAVRGQLADLSDYPAVLAELKPIHVTVQHHIADLKQLVEVRKSEGMAEAVKKAGSIVLGFAAGAIDLVRNEGLPKNLRDDYTAFSLATIGYVMLHTTGLSLGDREVSDLAAQHFRDYTKAVMTLHKIIPAAVVRFLQQEGLPAREDILGEVEKTIGEAWRGQSDEVPDVDEVSIAKHTR
jgi:ferritin-like metal-binding protein YciE